MNPTTVESCLEKMTDEELKQAFFEVKEMNEVGFFNGGVIRQKIKEVKESFKVEYSFHQMANMIFYEDLSRRYK